MAILDITALTPVLKQRYTSPIVRELAYPDNPFLAMVGKKKDFDGVNKVIAVRTGSPQGMGPTIGAAQLGKTASVYKRWTVTRNSYYGTANISGEAIRAAKNDTGSLVKEFQKEIDSTMYQIMRQIAIAMWRNGGGARGQISSVSNVNTPTITLQNPLDITNFELNMKLSASVDDGTGGAGLLNAGTTDTVTALDRVLGNLTTPTSWATGIASIAAGDYLFQNSGGAATNSDYNNYLSGVPAWCPNIAPTSGDSFFGQDRSVDPTRLAGVPYNGKGAPYEETLIKHAALLAVNGAHTDHAFLNPIDYAVLVTALGTKVVYNRALSLEDPDFGFEAVTLMGPKGPIKVIADLNVPGGYYGLLQLDTWNQESAGDMPSILDEDGLTILRASASDDYEVRLGYYGQLTCEAPGWNGFGKF